MPELTDNPLIDTDRHQSLFVDREADLVKLLQALDLGLNTLLLSARGMGKTSLLRRVMWELRRRKRPFVNVQGAMADDAQEFLDMVSWALGSPRQVREPSALLELWESQDPFRGRNRPVARPDALVRDIRLLADAMRDRQGELKEPASWIQPVVLVDDADAEISHTLFGRARDEVWAIPVLWIVAGDETREGEFLRPPADAFFGRTLRLAPLDKEQARQVLITRASDVLADPVIDAIVQQAKGNPRTMIRLAQEVVLGDRQPDDVLAREHLRQQQLHELGEPARRLYDTLGSLGSASAIEPRLLNQLKWSRSRATQVFAELEKAGLVTSATERPPTGVGRPRKVFRVA